MSTEVIAMEKSVVEQGNLLEQVVAEDHRLEEKADTSSRELMQHRWHWTLDESNPQRMTIRSYAERAGRHHKTIASCAKAYALLMTGGVAAATPSEALERAKMGVETEAATQAVAEARGIAFGYARQNYATEVRSVRDVARQLAEEKGTSVEEEAPQVAEMFVRKAESDKEREEQHKKAHSFQFIKVEGELTRMYEHGATAKKESGGVAFTQEEKDFLAHALDRVRRVTDAMECDIVGDHTPDWGEPLRMIEAGA